MATLYIPQLPFPFWPSKTGLFFVLSSLPTSDACNLYLGKIHTGPLLVLLSPHHPMGSACPAGNSELTWTWFDFQGRVEQKVQFCFFRNPLPKKLKRRKSALEVSFKNPFGYFGAVDQAQDRDMRDLGYSLGATDQRRVLIFISQIFNEHLLYAKYCARCQGHRNEKYWFLTLEEWTLYYETRQTSKQTKTLQYDVYFYGDVTLLSLPRGGNSSQCWPLLSAGHRGVA